MRVDIAEAGEANRDWYRQQADELLAANTPLAELVSMIEGALPSSNAWAFKVVEFAKAGALIDALSICVQQCGGDLAAGQAQHEMRQGSWLVKRKAFEDLWMAGDSFIYCAANPALGLGVVGYGPFCFIIRPERVASPNSAVFPGNTLTLYGTDTGVDVDRVFEQVGSWDFAADVGVYAFGDSVMQEPDATLWPTLICTDPSILEIVTAGPIEFGDVLEIRISRSDQRRFNRLSVLDREGRLTDTSEQQLVAAWQIVQDWVDDTHPDVVLRII